MAPVTLPPSFHTSFWSPDYRSGLETLFKHLEAGCAEDDDVAAFIEVEMRAHRALSEQLAIRLPTPSSTVSTTSSLQHTLLSLRQASSVRSESHAALATELANSVWIAFAQWKDRHKDRVRGCREDLLGKEGVVSFWEKDVKKLNTLKQTYLVKSRAADDSEDDAKFAPAPAASVPILPDPYTTSPKLAQNRLSRSGTVSDRISEKLRAASISSTGHRSLGSVDEKKLPQSPETTTSSNILVPLQSVGEDKKEGDDAQTPASPMEERFIPPTEPDGRPVIQSPGPPLVPSKIDLPPSPMPELPPTPILLSGLSLPAQGLKDLLRRFESYLLSTPAPYSPSSPQTTSTRSNTALASRHRTTILGSYEKTFSGEEIVDWLRQNVEGFGGDWERCEDAASELHRMGYFSRTGVGRGFEPSAETYFVLKLNSTESFSPLSPAVSGNINSLLKSYQSYLPSALGNSDEPAHVKARKEAVKADEAYKEGVRVAEAKRLTMEEKIESALRSLGGWERERLRVVKTVLKQYDAAVQKLPTRLGEVQKGSGLLIEAFNPDADIAALIEGNRTGPYRPHPHVYESVEVELPDVNFGIDLRRWSGDQGWKALVNAPARPKGAVPDVLTALLKGLVEMRSDFPDDDNRKAWIYEVPLGAIHGLRNLLNDPKLPVDEMVDRVKHFNPFVAAATVKLYLLELNPPVLGWEGWEDAKAVYPSVGADQERDMTSAVISVLGRLPGVQLFVLDAVISHLRGLIDSTKTDESSEIYITKLALSVGRAILRPQYETELTIQDRTPSLFVADLINNYSAIFPQLVEKKKKDSERVMPIRKRTALVDQRISRSRLSGEHDGQELLSQQKSLSSARSASPLPPVIPETETKDEGSGNNALDLGLGTPVHASAGEEEKESIQVVPPTPEIASEAKIPETVRPDESGAVPVENPDATLASGTAAALKRASSGETSRLRGPRGARGPRPTSRVTSSAARPETPTESAAAAEDQTKTVGSGKTNAADPSDYAPRKGKGSTAAGAFGHGSRSSVSAAIAQFENSGK